MSYKDMLVLIDSSEQSEKTLLAAFDLCRSFNANLAAMLPIPVVAGLPYAGIASHTAAIIQHTEALRAIAEQTRVRYQTLADRQSVQLEWQQVEGLAIDEATIAGRLVDLVILSQSDYSSFQPISRNTSEEILLHLGRPTLIIPHTGIVEPEFGRIVVAWDGSQAATRAVNDALPLLRKADVVDVLSISEAHKNSTQSRRNNEAICAHLNRHGVVTESTCLAIASIEIGNTLLTHAKNSGADLIVLGAYGHSRLREVVFGGVTRLLLKSMIVPLLTSH